jgi:hypothetical protein
MNICKSLKYLQVAEIFASCCALQVSEAALVKTEGLADEALRLYITVLIGKSLGWEQHAI